MHTTTPVLDPAHVVPANPALVQARDLTRVWGKGHAAQIGVAEVSLDVRRGELLAVIGPSGSGKSTLGSLIAGIDVPTSGSLVVDGTRIDQMKPDRLADWRGAHVGIVFQQFHLLPTLTAVENVELALELARVDAGRRERRRRAIEALEWVGLAAHVKKLPAQMSGGEQQRVGIARAMVTRPPMIVADEPTGALDQRNGHAVFELLAGLTSVGTTVVFITHDLHLAESADRVVSMIDGRIESVRGGA
ncbi:MAG: ABC transporter ATP-binding protein [Ilumatobacter sp.]|nr:ABC transporter ATP-binding protein [Ilumatobacter sp.]